MKVVVFLGPSMPVDEARDILPDAVFRPPARQADLATALRVDRPDVIALIDGEFGQSLSVWHKEILLALKTGVHVFGASSMGALRAAETDVFGMVGIGRVYEMYASGEIIADDEVALAHGMDDAGYRPLSQPLVNIRATLTAAVEAGVVSDEAVRRMIGCAREMYFPERTFETVFRRALASGWDGNGVDELRTFVKESYVDLKKDDARALLEHLRDLDLDGLGEIVLPVEPVESRLFDALYQRDRRVERDGYEVPLAAIGNWAALHLPDFERVNESALNAALVGVLADFLGVTVTEEEITGEETRFRRARRIRSDEELRDWLDRNDVPADEYPKLIRAIAVRRRMHRWYVSRNFMGRSTQLLLDQLRHEQRYEEVADEAATQERLLESHFPHWERQPQAAMSMRELVIDHLKSTSCDMTAHYELWAEEAGFHTWEDLFVELLRSRLVRDFRSESARAVMQVLSGGADVEE